MIRLPIRAIRYVLSLAKSEIGKAFAAGVVCGLSTDHLGEPVSPMGANAAELVWYVDKVGLSPMEAIVCATRNNAIVLGLQDESGTLEAGKQADLIVVDGDPLADISVMRDREKILAVYKGGQVATRMPF